LVTYDLHCVSAERTRHVSHFALNAVVAAVDRATGVAHEDVAHGNATRWDELISFVEDQITAGIPSRESDAGLVVHDLDFQGLGAGKDRAQQERR
jgi:hypothetical protein